MLPITAHFSIGSGTKLAVEDAIMLAEELNRPGKSLAEALADYQAVRSVEVLKLQNSARNSTNGSRRWSAISTSSRGNSLIRCSPGRSGSVMRICGCAMATGLARPKLLLEARDRR
jgi:2-polyprenyl-6-methoxyphenol hydroxylase-like FAD-dependent oxidoreductase